MKNEALAERLRDCLLKGKIKNEEKKMFGGVAFMVRGNMCVGVTNKGALMVRIPQADHDMALKKPGAKPMDFGPRTSKGFLFIEEAGYAKDKDLKWWIDLAMKHNSSLPEKKPIPNKGGKTIAQKTSAAKKEKSQSAKK